jgi:hypothetical protein
MKNKKEEIVDPKQDIFEVEKMKKERRKEGRRKEEREEDN